MNAELGEADGSATISINQSGWDPMFRIGAPGIGGSSSRTPNGTRFASISRHALTSGSCTIQEKTGC